MWSEDKITEYIKSELKKQRYEHSLRVKDTAINLAKKYEVDEKKASIAALVHDCAKYLDYETLIKHSKEWGYKIDSVSKANPSLLHGVAAANIAKTKMGIEDEDILNAIIYHTTGRKNMSKLEKIIYLADYIEPGRKFPTIELLREKTYNNLDEGLLFSFDNTIKFIIDRGQLIHKDTINARNDLIVKQGRNKI